MSPKQFVDNTVFDAEAFKSDLLKTDRPIPLYKDAIKRVNSTLNERFLANEDIRNLVFTRVWFIDTLLQIAWSQYPWNSGKSSLIAVGGYGRGELLPKSDIDLLLLFESESCIDANVESIQDFLTFLWDINLEVGHSVRTPKACFDEAKEDLTIVTNLMENRLLAGESSLLAEISDSLNANKIWDTTSFYKSKINEQKNRHHKFNEVEYNLEPNVKSSPGGLRDIQTIGWVAKRHFGDSELHSLVDHGFLTNSEYQTLIRGQLFLWRIRYALHMLTNREEDRILFDLQVQLADMFGYLEDDSKLAVERLMQDYYRNVFRLRELNDMLLQHFDEEILGKELPQEIITINQRFQVRNGYIEAIDKKVFERTPSALMEVFVLMAQHELMGMRSSTIRMIHQSRHLIDGHFRQDLRNIMYFMELLRSPEGVSHNLERMSRYGILARYLPEYGHVIGQMQYDLLHIYTVDAHTLLTIRNLRKFRHASNTKEFPIATKVIHQLPKVELIYIAALYHDIGKGRGGDHSSLGAGDARLFCQRHRLNSWETDLVVWLVENHLLMSTTSQRKDLSDPHVIKDFSEQVGDLLRLNYLYVLTVADIYATNPALWNSWRASLLKQLFVESQRQLRGGSEYIINKAERIEETKDKAIALLAQDGFSSEEVLKLWDNPGDDYFLRESAENIAWHTKAIANTGPNIPLILIQETHDKSFEGATQIFVYGPDRPHLFADIAATLGSLGLSIHDARIMTSSSSNFSLDTFIVLGDDGQSIGDDPDFIRTVQHTLLTALNEPETVQVVKRRVPRQLKHFKVPTQVTISNDLAHQRTVLDVTTADRPSLLAKIGDIFKKHDIRIQSARISTLGERVEDIFFVVDKDNQPIKDLELCQTLQSELETRLTEDQ